MMFSQFEYKIILCGTCRKISSIKIEVDTCPFCLERIEDKEGEL